jgi:hypothetical protein
VPPRLRFGALALVAAAIAFGLAFMIAGAGGDDPQTAASPSAVPSEFELQPASATVSALGPGGPIPNLPRERRRRAEPSPTATQTPPGGTVTPTPTAPPPPTPTPPPPKPTPSGTPF